MRILLALLLLTFVTLASCNKVEETIPQENTVNTVVTVHDTVYIEKKEDANENLVNWAIGLGYHLAGPKSDGFYFKSLGGNKGSLIIISENSADKYVVNGNCEEGTYTYLSKIEGINEKGEINVRYEEQNTVIPIFSRRVVVFHQLCG